MNDVRKCWAVFAVVCALGCSELSGDDARRVEILMLGEPSTDKQSTEVALFRIHQVDRDLNALDRIILADTPEMRVLEREREELVASIATAAGATPAEVVSEGRLTERAAAAFGEYDVFRGERTLFQSALQEVEFATDNVWSERDRAYGVWGPVAGAMLGTGAIAATLILFQIVRSKMKKKKLAPAVAR
jgi:hypothetical protein